MPLIFDPYRVKLVAGGERAGKSYSTAVGFLLPRVIDCSLIWIVAADYAQTRPEFDYLRDALIDLGWLESHTTPKSLYQPAVLRTKWGALVRTITAADESKLGAVAPDIIVAAEAAQLTWPIVQRLRGRVAEKRGQLFLEGTFEESQDWYAEKWQEWLAGENDWNARSYSLPSWSNTVIYPGGFNDPEMRAVRATYETDERFMERCGGVPSPPADAVFPTFRVTKHTTTRGFDKERPVELAIDPGYAGAYAILAVQWDNANVYVVDEIYARREDIGAVIKQVRKRPWYKYLNPYNAGVMDIAGRGHPSGRESDLEIWAKPPGKGGAGLHFRCLFVGIEDGIERLRSFLNDRVTGEPRLFYTEGTTPNCQREYKRYKYPKSAEGRAVREKPIDADNHGIKAITYWLVDRYGYAGTNRRKRRRTGKISIGGDYGEANIFGEKLGQGSPRPVRSRNRIARVSG